MAFNATKANKKMKNNAAPAGGGARGNKYAYHGYDDYGDWDSDDDWGYGAER